MNKYMAFLVAVNASVITFSIMHGDNNPFLICSFFALGFCLFCIKD
jgi:hypothetical protein